ncbi:MAG: signal recognition particle protein [Alphaproteobacteria bacterium]|nr:signal recognition particle protein [Alphaproteobacteria bacterium]
MFENLTTRLGQVFEKLRGRGALTEADVDAALREVRVALLEADVALPVVKDFVAHVRTKAVGQDVIKSVTPGQLVIKIVYDELVAMLGSETAHINLAAEPPVPVLMVGLQGSGKTTTTAKLGLRLEKQDKRKVLMASLDVYRPAAQEQLRVLGEQTGVATLPVIEGQQPLDIARRAMNAAKLRGMDVVLLDTAGRLTIDEAMMREAAAVRDAVRPAEVLLVADALTGQDAVNTAKAFKEGLNITGIVLTRIDGDARGGAALSMRQTAGAPIKLIGTGEKVDAIEPFHPDRIASRILGMGDVVSLVEKAKETIDQEEAAKLEAKVMAGGFDMNDLLSQLRQMRKMGGMEGLMAMLPGVGQMKAAMAANRVDDKMIARQEAIILSMTAEERRKVQILNARRRQRIASGSGTKVADVNKLLKQHRTMADMFKKVGKLGKKGMARMLAGMGGPGGMGGMGGGLPPGFGR